MKKLSTQLQSLIRPGGYLAVVLFGKYCLWDSLYHLLKGQPRQIFRRVTNKEVMVQLSPGVQQPVYYYSVKAFERLLSPMQLIEKTGGYLHSALLAGSLHATTPTPVSLAGAMGRDSRKLSPFTSLADHAFLLFKKEIK